MSEHHIDRAVRAFAEVRDAVLRVKAHAAASGTATPSDYWQEELSNIDYLIEASPLILAKLRHHAAHITGIRPYDYRVEGDGRHTTFAARLQSLIDLGGTGLVVPEHEALGGFGYRLPYAAARDRDAAPSGLFNVDTIKFLEVLIALQRAGLLDVLRAPARPGHRPTVLEIGAGWGGFAYQLLSVLPAVRYVIVDFPELFLFSATYLKTVFPNARVAMLGQGDAGDDVDAAAADIVFVPQTMAERVTPLRPDVTVNMVSFQEMTSEQVTAYAALAHAAGCGWIYSLNRERSRYNQQLTAVSARLSPYYDLTEVTVLDTPYTQAFKAKTESGEFRYRHLVGRRRDTVGATVAIGVTLHNRASFLRTALDSILKQTHTDFRLVLVDDGSTDGTEAIARDYAARDPRVRYVRQAERQGMAATWRRAFAEATADSSVQYFAWGSDHDVWEPAWLETLLAELERHPEAVLVYPHTRRIDEHGRLLEKPARLFETAGMADVQARWQFVCGELVASGDMVYGLARVPALRAAGVFRDVLCPDRLLMAELALQGEFRQVSGELWRRRQFGESSVQRQQTSLFAGAGPSGGRFARWLPVWYQHGRLLWREYVAKAPDRRRRRLWMRRVLRYCAAYALRHHQKGTTHKTMFAVYWWLRGGWKKAKHYTLLGLFYTLVYGRRGYHNAVYQLAILTRRIGLR